MSGINFINIENSKKCLTNVKKLYLEAFSKKERMPFFLLKLLSRNTNVDFCGIYDKNTFIGLIYNIFYEDIVCIYFFAIDKDLRGKSLGSKVLNEIKEKYKSRRIILYVQDLNKNSNNFVQRKKRKDFYIKNGFYELNYFLTEFGERYEVLCYNKEKNKVKKEELLYLLKNFLGKFLFKYIIE